MKICVVGAGAIGCWFGAWMARAGHEVSLLARGAHLAALQAGGLKFEDGDKRETFAIRVAAEPAALGQHDLVLIGLKGYSIAGMLPRLVPLLRADTMVMPAINGLPWWYFYKEGGRFDASTIACLDRNGDMLTVLDPRHLIGCVVHGSAEVVAPGVVRHNSGDRFIVGEPDGSQSPRVLALAAAMRAAGFDAPVTPRIREEIWTKLAGNLSYNPVAALTLARMDEINANESLLELIRPMIAETIAVAAAYGVTIPVTVEERIGIARKIGRAKISMHQDIERGRPLETDGIIGSVVELARRAGVATPVTGAVLALIEERARHL
ncbi:MAG: 2-dehydropantoate 2-reductase [Proteobacteria bacterium]|nr:2-dehydropantoate 2-reductase [Pseudomonadota bacterium]